MSVRVASAAALLATAALAACGDDEPSARRPAAPAEPQPRVRGSLDLEREAAPPDAGTRAGHRGGGARAIATGARFAFTGTTQPGDARVSVEGAHARVDRRRAGVFAVSVRGLRPGATSLIVRASAPGLEPWSARVTITR